MGRLTTHVLDTANGMPGRNVALSLFAIVNNSRTLLISQRTNEDGRCAAPLLEGAGFQPGIYELDFHIGAYFAAVQGARVSEPPFLDIITIRFGVADASQHFHVPLVVTPWSYSTYRGS